VKPSRWSDAQRLRRLGGLLLASGVSLTALGMVDRFTPRATVRADGLWDRVVFRGFRPYRADSRSRGANEDARVELRGLWASTPTTVVLEVSSPMQPRRIRFYVAGRPLLERRLDETFAPVRLDALTNEDGALSLRFTGVRGEGTALRVASLVVVQEAGRIPRRRLLLYALFGPAWMVLMRRLRPGLTAGGVSLLIAVSVLACAVHFARLPTLTAYPWLALGLGLPAAWLILGDGLAAVTGVPTSATRWVAAAMVFQLVLVVDPRFGMIDMPWHMRNLWTFTAHGLTVSTAPGIEQVPYPPAFYAVLSPFVTGSPEIDLRLMRVAVALLQGASPLLVFALMRAGGASVHSATAGTIGAAVMPEAILVLAKGIACNIFSSFVSLLVLVALLRRAPMPIIAGLLAMAWLSHAAAAVALAMLLALWWMDQYRRGELDRRRFLYQALSLAVAAGFAWLVYYREISLVFAPTGVPTNPAIGEVRWYRVGKIFQDLVLKFGLLPLWLAGLGMARAPVPPALCGLLRTWFLVGLGLAVVAVLSPFPLRFEYFLVPAVAIAAGLGAEHLTRGGSRGALVALIWAATFLVQVLLGVLLLQDRFEIISVIMESPRWPFPFK
jgi:hypothetical protein